MSDDAELAAMLSCIMGRKGSYLPVLDGPRMGRPDSDNEAVRRVNAIARGAVRKVTFGNLDPGQAAAMQALLPPGAVGSVTEEAVAQYYQAREDWPKLRWGRSMIGVGLLEALRSGKAIQFDDDPSPNVPLSGAKHLVVCEAGRDLSEVIAANYAAAMDADLVVIPAVTKATAEALTEELYSVDERRDVGVTQAVADVARRIRDLCPEVVAPEHGSITFFTSHVPFGLGFPEVPTTHLRTYPDLGVAVLNGLSSTHDDRTGVRCAVLVDPEKTPAPEIEAAARSLSKRKVFVRAYRGSAANVRDVTDLVDLFPYDLLLFATHCGDAPGYRFTYEYTDRSDRIRRLVVDTAVGFARTDKPDIVEVRQINRFHKLDGVDWRDPEKTNKIEVGTAISDWLELVEGADPLEPIAREQIPRVLGSAMLQMHDDNYLMMPRALADHGTPIIFNNACASWHELADRFIFAGARAYIGTLFPVTGAEAAEIAKHTIDQHNGRPLAEALWDAQNSVYGADEGRRPYVVVGVYPQHLRVALDGGPAYILRRLRAAFDSWRLPPRGGDAEPEQIEAVRAYYRQEIALFEKICGPKALRRRRILFRP
ncbi:hypothetical protein [Amaricoccus sp. W119]|uniref:hypothetical protein n=1 Tax=Amaricoccus sp. W119 TaxID=3391833 RepID=UPI0039A6F7AD